MTWMGWSINLYFDQMEMEYPRITLRKLVTDFLVTNVAFCVRFPDGVYHLDYSWSVGSLIYNTSSKIIIISDTSLSLSHTCNNCIYLKQNYSLKYCFASWYSFWPAHDWIISAACFFSDWNWAIELWTWNSINIERIYFAQLGT